jgi:aldose 1-epimerase
MASLKLNQSDMFLKKSGIILIAVVLTLGGCTSDKKTTQVNADSTATVKTMHKELFGALPDGKQVFKYVLKNKNGVEVHVINYGAIITHLKTPDKNGKLEDIVLGYDSLSGYLKATPYFGAVVGRYGNRIANGKFSIDGQSYTLVQNDHGQHLHGGTKGFDKVFWDIDSLSTPEGHGLKLTYRSPDMEEGYPGNLDVEVHYILTDNNELQIDYKATTDKATVVNLTQHSYFNLTGGKSDILDHELVIHADEFVPVNKLLIPEGKLAAVKGTPFDFTTVHKVGERINADHAQLKIAKGYDHCWVLNSKDSIKNVGTLSEATSGRYVEVMTTEPGVQFYSGNFLDGTITGKGGIKYTQRYGLCLETEHFPDSPNQPQFPATLLKPGEVYKTSTIYRFGTR